MTDRPAHTQFNTPISSLQQNHKHKDPYSSKDWKRYYSANSLHHIATSEIKAFTQILKDCRTM
jgi:N-acetyl-anhydromuramyl-L-alanine amidase AmpD